MVEQDLERASARVEAFAGDAADVVRQAEEEEPEDKGDADHRRSLHHPQRDRLAAAQLLDDRPENVAAVERQDRDQVDEPEREADQCEQQEATFERAFFVQGVVGDVGDADDAGDLFALFLFEQVTEDVRRALGDFPDRVAGLRGCLSDGQVRLSGSVGEADQGPLRLSVVAGADRDRLGLSATFYGQGDGRLRDASVRLLPASALVQGDDLSEAFDPLGWVEAGEALTVDRHDPVPGLKDRCGGRFRRYAFD